MKYIIANLKTSLNNQNINEYISTIKKVKYNNLILCPDKKYLHLFKNICKVGSQDYYDDINIDYTIIGHYDKKDEKEQIKYKLDKALKRNIIVILCIGNNSFEDLNSLKNQLDYYLSDVESNNVLIAYEPYFMIGSNNHINLQKIKKNIDYIKNNYKKNTLYGGNVNQKNIEDILKISDGILVGRLSFNPHIFTNVINKIEKSI